MAQASSSSSSSSPRRPSVVIEERPAAVVTAVSPPMSPDTGAGHAQHGGGAAAHAAAEGGGLDAAAPAADNGVSVRWVSPVEVVVRNGGAEGEVTARVRGAGILSAYSMCDLGFALPVASEDLFSTFPNEELKSLLRSFQCSLEARTDEVVIVVGVMLSSRLQQSQINQISAFLADLYAQAPEERIENRSDDTTVHAVRLKYPEDEGWHMQVYD